MKHEIVVVPADTSTTNRSAARHRYMGPILRDVSVGLRPRSCCDPSKESVDRLFNCSASSLWFFGLFGKASLFEPVRRLFIGHLKLESAVNLKPNAFRLYRV